MKHILTFESFLNEANINSQSFPNFESYLENLIPKNKRISFFIEDHRLLIGYFPESASMADLSKSLPERVKDELDEKFAGSRFTFMDELVKPDPMSGKKMIFSAVSAKTQKDLLQIEDLFKSELNEAKISVKIPSGTFRLKEADIITAVDYLNKKKAKDGYLRVNTETIFVQLKNDMNNANYGSQEDSKTTNAFYNIFYALDDIQKDTEKYENLRDALKKSGWDFKIYIGDLHFKIN
jgi:hypothetical protein